MSVATDLDNFGTAQVLVYMKTPIVEFAAASTSSNPFSSVTKSFVHSENSRFGAIAAATGSTAGSQFIVYKNLGIALGVVDKNGYKKVKNHSDVRKVTAVPEISLIKPMAAKVVAPKSGPTWGIKRLNVPELWKQGITGNGVVVAHLDTGIDIKHPVLKGSLKAFAKFDEMGREVPRAKVTDSGEHGTHTAATIAGRPTKKATVGVAPGAMLASAMVIEGGNVVARILGGMDWSIGQGAKILSMSLGLRGYRTEFYQLMQLLRTRGMLPVIAVGNEGAGTSRSPGNYDICLCTGACNESNKVPVFSSSQHFDRDDDPFVPDIVAPGEGILSALPRNKFGAMDGTSMATPHIAGLAALLWEAKPNATVQEIEEAILNSCVRPRSMSQARANRGVPDAVKALATLRRPSISERSTARVKSNTKTKRPLGPKKGRARTAKKRTSMR